jgi:50S ribosomal subunit-associated GTPase HflX
MRRRRRRRRRRRKRRRRRRKGRVTWVLLCAYTLAMFCSLLSFTYSDEKGRLYII